MLLTAVATKAELAALIDSFTPLRVSIDERRGRAVTLGRPRLALVPGRGLRLRGDARVTWDVAGVAIPLTLQAWQLLVVPRVVPRDRGRVLAFEPIVEALELKRVPGFLDEKIARVVRDGLAQNRDRIAWNFTRALSHRWPLPARISPARAFDLRAVDGDVAIGEGELRVSVRFEARAAALSAESGSIEVETTGAAVPVDA